MKKIISLVVLLFTSFSLAMRPEHDAFLTKLKLLQIIDQSGYVYENQKATFPETSSSAWIHETSIFYIYFEMSESEITGTVWNLYLGNNIVSRESFPFSITSKATYGKATYDFSFTILHTKEYSVAKVFIYKKLIEKQKWAISYEGGKECKILSVNSRFYTDHFTDYSVIERQMTDLMSEENNVFGISRSYHDELGNCEEEYIYLFFSLFYGFEKITLLVPQQTLIELHFYKSWISSASAKILPIEAMITNQTTAYNFAAFYCRNYLVFQMPISLLRDSNYKVIVDFNSDISKVVFSHAFYALKDETPLDDISSGITDGSSLSDMTSSQGSDYSSLSNDFSDSQYSNVNDHLNSSKSIPYYLYVALGMGIAIILGQALLFRTRKS